MATETASDTAHDTAQHVTLFFDPACPYAWMTSRWLLHAAQVRDVAPTVSVMSLAVLNEGRDLPENYRAFLDQAWGPARVALAIERTRSQEELAAFYTAFGEDYHVGRSEDLRGSTERALEEAGLPASLMDGYDSDAEDAALRAAQQRVIDMVGDEVGTPVVSFGEGTAYFGPVVSPAPKGEDAGLLFDALSAAAKVPGFFELKRSRDTGIDFS